MHKKTSHPTHLWISDQKTLAAQMLLYLQNELCLYQACQKCVICKQIIEKEHPWTIWLTPERSYALDQIDDILHKASFKLDENEQRFFIIQQAERLTDHCSNRLLKTIEEPSTGYNFFFLTDRPQALPLTIQSRCVVQKFKSESTIDTYKDLLQPFLTLRFNDPINFIKQIETLDIKEQESANLADDLFDYWSKQLKDQIQSPESIQLQAQAMIHLLQQAINNPAMTGSAKIFWKNLYLAADYATKTDKAQK